MEKICISSNKRSFEREGKPFFYLADTLWTAFSNITMPEWEEYLDFRKKQGFNAFQVNILTQWDGGKPDVGLYPFKQDADGKFDFKSFNEEYFNRMQNMLAIAVEKGFVPVLVLLWLNYVKGTWLTQKDSSGIMPLEFVKPYTEYAVKAVRKFNPIYLLSGDTDFPSEITVKYYATALETVRELDPEAIVSAHVCGGLNEIPKELDGKGGLDFYMFQSCHFPDKQFWSYTLAETFYAKTPQKPVINGEPCYEAHAFGGQYGRYSAFDVRKAVWQSLLSGAGAGVTYGAQGIWSWHREGKQFSNESFGGKPLSWRKALELRGAWDVSFARWVFETYGLWDLRPAQEVLLNDTKEIRLSISEDSGKVAAYIPYIADICVRLDLSDYDLTIIDLQERIFAKPVVEVKEGVSIIKIYDHNTDLLLLGEKG